MSSPYNFVVRANTNNNAKPVTTLRTDSAGPHVESYPGFVGSRALNTFAIALFSSALITLVADSLSK